MSEIARQIGLQKSTCHAILTSLERCGYVMRSASDKRYTPGPALIGLARAAQSSFPVARAARPALEQLTAELGLGCALATPMDGALVVVDRVGGDELFPTGLQAGDRFPWVAPNGAVLQAWGEKKAVQQWLAGAPDLGAARTHRLRRALGSIREHGYGAWEIADMKDRLRELSQTINAVRGSQRAEGLRVTLGQVFTTLARNSDIIDTGGRRRTISVGIASAPIFDETGRPTHEIELHAWRTNVEHSALEHMMERLLAAAESITCSVGGTWRIGRSDE